MQQQSGYSRRGLNRGGWRERSGRHGQRWEVEEAEREWRELKEAEVEMLTWEKEKLEEENRAEQWHTAALRGSERVAEKR